MQRCGIEPPCAPAGLAVQGDDFILLQRQQETPDPAAEGRREFFRINGRKDATKGVMRRDAILQRQVLTIPDLFLLGPFLNLDKELIRK